MTDHGFGERVLALWDFQDPAGTQARFAAAAEDEANQALKQSLLTQVARAQAMQDAFEAGHATLDAVGEPAELADEPGVRVLLERGRLLHLAGAPQQAVTYYHAAYERAVAAAFIGLAADAAHMLAIALPEPQQQEHWVRLGLSIAEGSTDPLVPGMVAAMVTNLGWTYVEGERWAEALELFDRAVDIHTQAGHASTLHAARWTRAWALRALGRHHDALTELRHLALTPDGAADPCVADEITANENALITNLRSMATRLDSSPESTAAGRAIQT